MEQYKNKKESIDEINKTYYAFIREFDDVKEEDLHNRLVSVDKTPAEMLSYQIGWLNHLMEWEKNELAGKEVITPAPDIKWNELGKLYRRFYDTYSKDNLNTLLNKFEQVKEAFVKWIDTLDDKTLFELDQRKWAYTKVGWPVWKWLHINSVAPFKTFRSKIRKWKRERNQK